MSQGTGDPADTLKTLFRDIFQCRGRDLGSPSRGVLGISDGNEVARPGKVTVLWSRDAWQYSAHRPSWDSSSTAS